MTGIIRICESFKTPTRSFGNVTSIDIVSSLKLLRPIRDLTIEMQAKIDSRDRKINRKDLLIKHQGADIRKTNEEKQSLGWQVKRQSSRIAELTAEKEKLSTALAKVYSGPATPNVPIEDSSDASGADVMNKSE